MKLASRVSAPGLVVGRTVVVGAAVVVPRGVEVGAAVVVARGVEVSATVVVARGVVVTAGQENAGCHLPWIKKEWNKEVIIKRYQWLLALHANRCQRNLIAPGLVVGRAVVVGAAVVVARGVEVGAAVVVARGVEVGAAVVVSRGVVVTAVQT